MELQAAAAKVSKYAVRESGDSLEMIERPHGGLSFVLVDGQHTGRGAKQISNLVARKAVSLLAEGVRDGAVARAAHDYLYTQHDGKVSAELVIVSIDLVSKTIVVSRNSHCPAIVSDEKGVRLLNEQSEAIGVHRRMKPIISELALQAPLTVIVFTDGVLNAGIRTGKSFDIAGYAADKIGGIEGNAQKLADSILSRAVELDSGRPSDDTSVLVVRVAPRETKEGARRLFVRFPIE